MAIDEPAECLLVMLKIAAQKKTVTRTVLIKLRVKRTN